MCPTHGDQASALHHHCTLPSRPALAQWVAPPRPLSPTTCRRRHHQLAVAARVGAPPRPHPMDVARRAEQRPRLWQSARRCCRQTVFAVKAAPPRRLSAEVARRGGRHPPLAVHPPAFSPSGAADPVDDADDTDAADAADAAALPDATARCIRCMVMHAMTARRNARRLECRPDRLLSSGEAERVDGDASHGCCSAADAVRRLLGSTQSIPRTSDTAAGLTRDHSRAGMA